MTAAERYQEGLRKLRMAMGIIDVASHASQNLKAGDMASALDAASHLGYEAEESLADAFEGLCLAEAKP